MLPIRSKKDLAGRNARSAADRTIARGSRKRSSPATIRQSLPRAVARHRADLAASRIPALLVTHALPAMGIGVTEDLLAPGMRASLSLTFTSGIGARRPQPLDDCVASGRKLREVRQVPLRAKQRVRFRVRAGLRVCGEVGFEPSDLAPQLSPRGGFVGLRADVGLGPARPRPRRPSARRRSPGRRPQARLRLSAPPRPRRQRSVPTSDDEAAPAATKVPRPWRDSTRPSVSSRP